MQKIELKKNKSDLFDRLEYEQEDLFDRLELPAEDKVAYSAAMREVLREEIQKLIAAMPIPSMIKKAMDRVAEKQSGTISSTREELDKTIAGMKSEFAKEIKALKNEREAELERLRKRYDNLKSEMISPRYEFGGFSPQANDLNIGDPSIEGAYRIVKSGNNLSIQRLESGTWTEKFAITP